MEKFYDPIFKYHLTVAQVRGGMVFELANSLVLPFDCQDYAVALKKYTENIYNISMNHPQEMKEYSVSFGRLKFIFHIQSCAFNDFSSLFLLHLINLFS